MKVIKTVLCFLLTSILFITNVSAAEVKNGITKVENFTTTNENFEYDFSNQIEENGKKYDLVSVEYKVVDSKDLTRPTNINKTVDYFDLYSQDAGAAENITVLSDGEELTLSLDRVDYTNTVITNRKKLLTASSDFDYKTVEPNVPQTKTITYYDESAKRNLSYTLALKEVNVVDDWDWKSDVTIPLTVSLYEADYYVIGDKYIPYDDEKPNVEGYENDILKTLGLDTEKYKIDDVQWDGEAYTVGEAIYRKAIAKGQRYCANYVAVYESQVDLPDCAGYNSVAHYSANTNTLSGETEYLVEATATYTKHKNMVLRNIVQYTIIIFLLLAVIVLIVYIILHKRKKALT